MSTIKYSKIHIFDLRKLTLRKDTLFEKQNKKNQSNNNSADFFIIADDLPALICRFNSQGEIIYINNAYAKFLGSTKDSLIGSKFIYLPEDFNSLDTENHFATPHTKQFSLKLDQNKIYWIEWTITRVVDNKSNDYEFQAIGHDISEFKLLEEQLNKITLAVEQSSSTVVITDNEGLIEYVNPGFTKITGYTSEEVIGKSTRILKSGKTDPEVYKRLWNTIKSGKEWQGELLNKRKNGEYFWELVTISPIKDKDNNITNFIAVKEDITERKKSEKLQEALYQISHAVISNESLDDLYPAIHKILSNVLPVDNFYIAIYDEKEDLISFPYFVDQYDEPSPPQKPGRGLTEYVLRSGKPSLITPDVFNKLVKEKEVDLVGTDSLDWLGVPLKINNKTIGIIVVQSYSENIRLTDYEKDILIYVSDQIALAIERTRTLELLKRSEGRYRLLFDKAADLIAIIDQEGKVLDLNNIFEEETGYRKKDVIGKNIFELDLLTPKSAVMTAFYLSRLIIGKDIPIFEIEGYREDGKLIKYEVRAVPIIEENNSIGAQAILRNVTERKSTEERLKQSERQLSNLMSNLPGMAYRCRFDSEWTMEFVSQGCFELTGYTTEELIGNKEISYVQLIHPEDRENVIKTITSSVQKKKPFKILYRLRSKDGKEKWVWEKGNAVFVSRKNIGALEGFISDITDRVQAEEALRESEELYKKLIATLPDIICITNVSGEIMFINEVGIRFSGYSNFEEIKHKNFITFIAEEDRERVLRNFKASFIKNYGPKEFKFVNKNGEEFLFEIQREVLRNSDNIPYGLIFSCRDITFRKRAETVIAQSEEKYRVLMDSIQDGVFSIEDEKITFVNRALAEMLGYNIEEMMGKIFTNFIAPEDIEVVRRNYFLRQNGYEVSSSYECRMLHKNGKRIYVNLNARIIDYHGKKSTIGTLKDITHQKELEQILLDQKNLFKGVAEAANILLTGRNFDQAIKKTLESLGRSSDIDRVYIFENSVDPLNDEPVMNQKYEWTNGTVSSEIDNPELQNLHYYPMFADWYPVLKKGGIINSLVKDLNPELKDLLSEQNIKSILLVPIMVKEQFWGFIGFDYCKSDRIWDDNVISILKTTASNLGGLIEREISRTELIAAKETAESMNKLKSNFLANMSHELRTPLIAILGYTEILSGEVDNKDWIDMIETIMHSGKRLLETLNLILDLSKIEADKIQVSTVQLNFVDEVNDTINLLKPFADRKGLYLKSFLTDKNITINADKRLLQSILTNLINNGIKYTNKGGVTISLDTIEKDGSSYAVLVVSDTGIGIAKENQAVIFDEFRQVSEGYNRSFEGAGLGLTITKKFVEKMGGRISLESSPGEGSIFTVIFPLNKNIYETNCPAKENIIADKEIKEQKDQEEKILIIDDDPATRRIIELFLHDEIITKAVSNIKDALFEAESNQYSLVLMDISLGQGISGVDLLKDIRKISGYKTVPIIAVTAHAMVGDKEKFISSGFNDYLSKPFTKKDLIEKIRLWKERLKNIHNYV